MTLRSNNEKYNKVPKTVAIHKEYCYTILGQQDLLDPENYPVTSDESITYAKMLEDENGNKTYYIRQSHNRDLFNPIMESVYKTKEEKLIREIRYKKVTEAAFRSYVNFLKTKNKAVYADAVRKALQ